MSRPAALSIDSDMSGTPGREEVRAQRGVPAHFNSFCGIHQEHRAVTRS